MSVEDKVTSIAIAVVRQADRYLIGQRSAAGPLPNYWEFPGGKVHADELPSDAAARECREETGLTVRVGELLADLQHTYAHGKLRLYFFSCKPESTACLPAEPFRWVPVAELDQYEFPPANQAIIAQLTRARPGSNGV
jgi:mutator protein MutT